MSTKVYNRFSIFVFDIKILAKHVSLKSVFPFGPDFVVRGPSLKLSDQLGPQGRTKFFSVISYYNLSYCMVIWSLRPTLQSSGPTRTKLRTNSKKHERKHWWAPTDRIISDFITLIVLIPAIYTHLRIAIDFIHSTTCVIAHIPSHM